MHRLGHFGQAGEFVSVVQRVIILIGGHEEDMGEGARQALAAKFRNDGLHRIAQHVIAHGMRQQIEPGLAHLVSSEAAQIVEEKQQGARHRLGRCAGIVTVRLIGDERGEAAI